MSNTIHNKFFIAWPTFILFMLNTFAILTLLFFYPSITYFLYLPIMSIFFYINFMANFEDRRRNNYINKGCQHYKNQH